MLCAGVPTESPGGSLIGAIVLAVLLAAAVGVFAWRVRLLYRLVRLGQRGIVFRARFSGGIF